MVNVRCQSLKSIHTRAFRTFPDTALTFPSDHPNLVFKNFLNLVLFPPTEWLGGLVLWAGKDHRQNFHFQNIQEFFSKSLLGLQSTEHFKVTAQYFKYHFC